MLDARLCLSAQGGRPEIGALAVALLGVSGRARQPTEDLLIFFQDFL
jgi:hypothetical protein